MDAPKTTRAPAEETRETCKPAWTAPTLTELPVAATLYGMYFGHDSSYFSPLS